MKRLIGMLALIACFTMVSGQAMAISSQYMKKSSGTTKAKSVKVEKEERFEEPDQDIENPVFPEKGWHKGFYMGLHGGFMQANNDTNLVTNRKFDGSIIPAVGLTLGWDIADWIGPMLQFTYGFATDQVGDNATPDTPIESGREHALNISLFCRATLPYFTRASWQPAGIKIIPYVKLGGTGHALYVHANGNGNKIGAYGGGIGAGAGVEFFIWKGLFLAIDFTENIIFQQSYSRTVNNVPNQKIVDGGTKFQANLLGIVGWHF